MPNFPHIYKGGEPKPRTSHHNLPRDAARRKPTRRTRRGVSAQRAEGELAKVRTCSFECVVGLPLLRQSIPHATAQVPNCLLSVKRDSRLLRKRCVNKIWAKFSVPEHEGASCSRCHASSAQFAPSRFMRKWCAEKSGGIFCARARRGGCCSSCHASSAQFATSKFLRKRRAEI